MVEMTETAEVENLPEAARTAEALRAAGVPFCLDDFGAGTADVRVLRALPADVVKLDGSYVPGVVHGGRERAFVAGMIDIARAAGAEVVAERVESEAEADALRAVGVTYAQGWLFGRPGPLPSAAEARPTAPHRPGTARRRGEQETWG
jgi:EAL domain-containing protein (putative c-di-GMP-specific phosphodiesterase class I)